MSLVVEDAVGGLHYRGVGARVFAAIQVAVEAGEVAAGDLDADFVALEKDVAGGPEIDLVLVDLAGDDGAGGGGGFAVAGAQDSFGQVQHEAVGSYVDQLGGEVRIHC